MHLTRASRIWDCRRAHLLGATVFVALFLEAIGTSPAEKAPEAWRVVTETLARTRLTTLEAFGLCMVTHICHDLPYALVRVGLTDRDGRSRIDDYHRINRLLSEAIDAVQARIVQPTASSSPPSR